MAKSDLTDWQERGKSATGRGRGQRWGPPTTAVTRRLFEGDALTLNAQLNRDRLR